jgi:two-component system, NtrC family, sensor kinase
VSAERPHIPIVPNGPVPPASRRFDETQVRAILPELIDALTDAVVVVDRDHRLVAANARYIESFGSRRPDMVGSLCHEVLNCPEDQAAGGPDRCGACDSFSRRRPERRIRNLPDANGALRRWEASFNPVFDAKGQVSHVVEVWRDITVRSQLESQLGHSERLASLGTLAAGVGHEINNPLSSMLAGVESLERWLARRQFGDADVTEAAEILEVLEREVTRCRETTDKLMLLAQPYSVQPSWFHLNEAVRDTLSLLRYEMRKHGIEAVEDLDDALPPIWARASGLRGVCMNLMMNAVQAMPDGGRLTVRTRTAGRGVTLQVEDTGHGIAPEHLDRIWDAFFTTKATGQGTGLGLSITQAVVTRHGGTIRVESLKGQGARFIVELPIEGSGGTGV